MFIIGFDSWRSLRETYIAEYCLNWNNNVIKFTQIYARLQR